MLLLSHDYLLMSIESIKDDVLDRPSFSDIILIDSMLIHLIGKAVLLL